jgi:hypothetical protein
MREVNKQKTQPVKGLPLNLKFAKIILPKVRERVGEIAGNLEITLKASGNGRMVETHVSTRN